MKFDGCCVPNPGEMGIGVVAYNEEHDMIIELSKECGHGTNNQAEYNALIMGLEEILLIYNGRLVIQGDSELVINQMRGEWETRNKKLVPLYNRAKYLESKFQHVDYELIPRGENKEADIQSAKALGIKEKSRIENRVHLEVGHTYKFVFASDNKIQTIRDEKYNRNVQRYFVKSAAKDGQSKQGTFFQTGSRKLIEKLDYYKPLENKELLILVTKPGKYTEYLIDFIED
jgi:ribonuclease HI